MRNAECELRNQGATRNALNVISASGFMRGEIPLQTLNAKH
jgi:hypothetical protein